MFRFRPFVPRLLANPGAVHIAVVLSYVLTALACTWPLPLHFDSAFLGPPDGDLGAYVWNLWVFRHQIVTHHGFPWTTFEVLSLVPSVTLTLQNYTAFADLVAFPLLPRLGIVATFNTLTLAATVLSAYFMFLYALARTRDAAAAWLGGLLFGFSAYMLVRQTAHFSLTLAAPLPLFGLLMLKIARSRSRRHRRWLAVGAGLVAALAYLCDPYYALYCLMMLGFALLYPVLTIVRREQSVLPVLARRIIDGLTVILLAVAAGIASIAAGWVAMPSMSLTTAELYLPMLIVTVLTIVRAAASYRFDLDVTVTQSVDAVLLVAIGGVVVLVLLSPVIYAMMLPAGSPFAVPAPVFWRSSAPGLDIAAFLAPNPLHALSPAWLSRWFDHQPNGLVENVGSQSWVALALIALASRNAETRPERRWFCFTALFLSLSLGPFLRVAGVSTYIPTPWAVLRYLPLIGSARMPTRIAVLVSLGMAMLLAMAVQRLRADARRPALFTAVVAVLLVAELLPGPRLLASAKVPEIVDAISTDPRDVRVLHVPFGLRDGLSSRGNYSTNYQYFQTVHEKRLVGGYLSRLPAGAVSQYEDVPPLAALMDLSEGRDVPADTIRRAIDAAHRNRRRLNVGWVLMDKERATERAVEFAVRAFDLQRIGGDGRWQLYRPSE